MKTKLWRLNAAFTAVELLVVVAIIGVLGALLTSSLRYSLRDAKGIVCASQLRQLGILIQQYAAEHNNELPPSSAYFFADRGLGWSGAWFDPTSPEGDGTGGLAAYTDKTSLRELVICPLRKPSASKEEPPIPEGFPYAVNFHLLPTSGFNIVRTTSLKDASSLILLTDSFLDGGWKFGFNGYGSDFTSFVGNPHAGKRGNVLWADGHVTSQEISQIESKNVWPSTL